jgi:uncharacterized protein
MLRVDLGALRDGPIEVVGCIEPQAPSFEGLHFRVEEPVEVRGRLSDAGPGQYYLQARIATQVTAACRRCLRVVTIEVDHDVGVVFTEDATNDDPAAYLISGRANEIEMDDMVREQIILAVPDYPECSADCPGMCATCGKDLNDGPCDCQPEPDPRWAALEALRSAMTDKEN